MPTAQTLLYAAESDVTLERVVALLEQVGPESAMVEYKEQLSGNNVAKAVVALANAYGGLVLVGVTDDRQVKGVGEKAIEAVAEHCAARIEPSWVPPIIPVPLDDGSGLWVLVLRVAPGRYPRPLLVSGVAYVRHHNTTHRADWQKLRDLFHEPPVRSSDAVWQIPRPELPPGADGGSDKTVAYLMRSGLHVAVAAEAKWRPLPQAAVNAFTAALNRSALCGALADLCAGHAPVAGIEPFHRRGLNRSRDVRLQWSGVPQGWPGDRPRPVEAVARLAVPGAYGDATTHLRAEIDVLIRGSGRVALGELERIMDCLFATLTDRDLIRPIADLAGVDAVVVAQPRVLHLATARPVSEVLDTTGLRVIEDAGASYGAHLLADPARDLAVADDRRAQVTEWLSQLTLDAGLCSTWTN